MCGIAGAVGFIDEEIDRAVRKMDIAQQHRGPDGHGYWSSLDTSEERVSSDERGVILTHRRLAILDLSDAGAQPMIDQASGAVIVFNGEVYNYSEIRNELVATGETFFSRTDTEVVLRAVVKWGINVAVKRFRGMFALAVWEPRTRRISLARDRVGIKPLYLAEITRGSYRTLLFASELRAILHSGLIERRLAPNGLSTYLWNGFVYGPSTIIQGITLLPAGTTLIVEADQPLAEPKSYWQLPTPPDQYQKNADKELRHELETAVKLRLVSDVPLGIFLSGGIDSSAVAALAARTATGTVYTFNVGFDDAAYDESPYAEAVAKALGTRHTCLHLTEEMFRHQLDNALQSIDQPTFDGINTFFVSQAVRQAGITVALAGTGGDELFGGYRSFVDLPRIQYLSSLLRCVPERILQAIGTAAAHIQMGGGGIMPPQTRWGKLGDALACRGNLVNLYQVAYGLFTKNFYEELTQDLPHIISNNIIINGLNSSNYKYLIQLVENKPQLHAIANLELSSFIEQRLMRDTDAASMAVALEARVPLLDHRVIECVAAIDPNQRFKPLGSKHLLKELAIDHLNPKLFDRPKAGFVLPIDKWCRQGLRERVNQTLFDTDLCRSVGIHPPSVAKLAKAFQSGQPGIYWTRLWMLFVLLRWCQDHKVLL
ncbi:MAG: asparagine synthase (glutamine-hydrolyzing) [Bacteroidia bacterium]|nr:asparagine synthase (glutamine-hydrolyzing) [Bacteroidia bacterium]